MNGDPVRLGWSSSLSGIIVHGRYVLRPRTAGLSVCPRVAVTIPCTAPFGCDGYFDRRQGSAGSPPMAQSQNHRACHKLNQAGQDHGTSRRDRRPVRGRPVRGITVGYHRPPPCVARLLAPGSLGSGSAGDRGASPVPERFGPGRPYPGPRGRLLGPDPAHNSGFSGPAGSAHMVPSLPPVADATGGCGETGGLVCEGVSDGLFGQSSFQFVSAAPVIGHSAGYRCR
jgi:hypothetical protein